MKIYDISQEVFGCAIYPGDPSPSKETLSSIERGELYNLTAFSMCAHNGTHVDAPYHFIHDGKTVDKMPMEKTVGAAYVAEYSGSLDRDGAIAILKKSGGGETSRRILIKGDVIVTESAASVFAEYGIELLGVESQSVGPIDAPMAVHKILLEKEVALLEGIRLSEVPEGEYILCAAPLCLEGLDGAPCRAVLIDAKLL